MVTRRPLSFIPPFLPDQTLYSWVTVFHEMSGNVSEEMTLFQIFGSEKAGRKFHIPTFTVLTMPSKAALMPA